MALTSRKRRPLNRTITHLRDTKLFIIATEGEKTKKQYFEMLVVRGKNKNISRTHTTKSAIQFVATLCPLRLLCDYFANL